MRSIQVSCAVLLSIVGSPAVAFADEPGESSCTHDAAPRERSVIPINAPALAIRKTRGRGDKLLQAALWGAGGRVVFTTEPTIDEGLDAFLVTPIGALQEPHTLRTVMSCNGPSIVEEHTFAFGPEVAYPKTIGRLIDAKADGAMFTVRIALSDAALAYLPVAKLTATVGSDELAKSAFFGELPPPSSVDHDTLSLVRPLASFYPGCYQSTGNGVRPLTVSMRVAGMSETPRTISESVPFDCNDVIRAISSFSGGCPADTGCGGLPSLPLQEDPPASPDAAGCACASTATRALPSTGPAVGSIAIAVLLACRRRRSWIRLMQRA